MSLSDFLKRKQRAEDYQEGYEAASLEIKDLQSQLEEVKRERDKLLEHFDVCKSDQIVTLVIERDLLRERVKKLRDALIKIGKTRPFECEHTLHSWTGLAADDLLQKNGDSG